MAVGWRANILLVGREFRFYRTRGEERAEFFAVIYGGLVTGMHICAYEFAFIKKLKSGDVRASLSFK